MVRRPADLIRGASDLLVLSILADGPQYGYAIARRLAAGSDAPPVDAMIRIKSMHPSATGKVDRLTRALRRMNSGSRR